mmetsp:Transcript_19269/g.57228  ORF Transcript_19269/g.57228 Transcript_19269/m.57228 type:complete len:182 (+) Transcript_19269:317-862(+)|eukprot:CAMPEP_0119260600 /NCGR_PEP_ID=MMETSP1329-20130426/905_1 /TAXON_ID=114041 /ORGANISM="Genus nov. species nov., Strain RCC1024" /LENGTH=181 /DNA_ID=CAMNT_0007260025 /DNA_START=317 /DNA_END=862 /DNA_ORIENTATION=-
MPRACLALLLAAAAALQAPFVPRPAVDSAAKAWTAYANSVASLDVDDGEEQDWRRLATAAGVDAGEDGDWRRMVEAKDDRWGGMFSPWDSDEGAAEETDLATIYAVQEAAAAAAAAPREPPREKFGGMFSPWSADETALETIYAVQRDPANLVSPAAPSFETGAVWEETPRAGLAPWESIQ